MNTKAIFFIRSTITLVLLFLFAAPPSYGQTGCNRSYSFPRTPTAKATLDGVEITRTFGYNTPSEKNYDGRIIGGDEYDQGYLYSTGGRGRTRYNYSTSAQVSYSFNKPVKAVYIEINGLDATVSYYDAGRSDCRVYSYAFESLNISADRNVTFQLQEGEIAPYYYGGGPTNRSVKYAPSGTICSYDGELKPVRLYGQRAVVKVVAAQGFFTSLTLGSDNVSINDGIRVHICSIESSDLVMQAPQSQTICAGSPVSFVAKATSSPTLAGNPKLRYQLQYSGNGGSGWNAVDGVINKTNGETHTFTLAGDNYYGAQKRNNGALYRFAYSVDGLSTFFYSNVATLTVTSAELTELNTTPNVLGNGPTPVAINFKGTPNAVVSYRVGNNATETVTLNSSGEGTVNKTLSNLTTIQASKVTLNGCSFNTDKRYTVGASGCSTIPAAVFTNTSSTGNRTRANSVYISQHVNASPANRGYAPADNNPEYCDNTPIAAGYARLGNWRAGYPPYNQDATQVSYSFDHPVTSAQIWVMKLGHKGGNKGRQERIKVSLTCDATPTLTKIYGCGEGTVDVDNSQAGRYKHIYAQGGLHDIGVLVTADKPFNNISVEFENGNPSAYLNEEALVTICPTSVQPLMRVESHPQDQTVCDGETISIPAKFNLDSPYQNTNVQVRLQKSTNGGTTWNYIGNYATDYKLLRSGQSHTFSQTVSSADNNAQYRVQYQYQISTICSSGVQTLYSNAATITVTNFTVSAAPTESTYCQGQTANGLRLTITGNTGGTVSYQWFSNTVSNTTTGVAISGANSAVYTPTTTQTGTTYYYAKLSTPSGCSDKASPVMKVTVNALATPTVTHRTFCPTATDNYVSFANYVTAAAGHTLVWYEYAMGGSALGTAPRLNTKQTGAVTVTYYVAQHNTVGCESERVAVNLGVQDTTAPTITAAPTLTTACGNTAAIATWLASFTATDTCGTATITNNYELIKPTNLCNASTLTVTFTARDSFGNQTSTTGVIRLISINAVDDQNTAVINGAVGANNVVDVLANDTVGNAQATLSNVTLSVVRAATAIGGANVPALNTSTGKVNVPAGTAAGTYHIVYRISTTQNGVTASDVATATIEVGKSPLAANNVTYTILDNTLGGTTSSVLNQVTLNGVTQSNTTNVTLTFGTTPSGFTANNTNGVITVAANTATGTYTIPYTVCERLNGSNCKTATVTVVVRTPSLIVNADVFSFTGTAVVGNILTNDTFGARVPVAGTDVNITVTNSTQAGYPQLNAANGNVSVGNDTPAGTYVIPYRVCRISGGSECFDSTATVYVADTNTGTTRVVANDDDFNYTNNPSVGNVLTNDRVGSNPATGRVSLTILRRPAGGVVPTIDNAGNITVPSGVTTGTYIFEYRICSNAGSCDTAIATVYVGTALIVNPDEFTYTSTATVGNVLDNDRINGHRPQIGTEVTLSVPTQPANYPVLHPVTGEVSVQNTTPSGVYTISYQVCRVSNGKCVSTTVTVNVPYIKAVDDENTNYINGGTGATNVIDVLANDLVNRQQATTSNCQITVVTPATSRGGNIPVLSTATGKVNVPAGTTAGTYYIIYKISTQVAGHTYESSAKVTVEVGKTPLVANNANFTILDNTLGGTTSSVLSHVTLNGVTQSDTTNVTLTWGSMPTGFTGNNSNGTLNVAPATATGTYQVSYTVCERLNTGNCKTATATVVVKTPSLIVNADVFSYTGSAVVGNILTNDTFGARVPVAGTDVNITVTNSTQAGYPQLNAANGNVTVSNDTPAGTYVIPYRVCRISGGTECFDSTATVYVADTNSGTTRVVAEDDEFNYTGNAAVGNVLTNDRVGSNPATGRVTLSILRKPNGTNVPTIDSLGNITVPAGVATDTYEFEYRICSGAGSCDTAIATVYVGTALIVNPDVYTYTGNASVGNVLDNDRIAGRRPQMGEVSLSVPSIPANRPQLSATTGEVTVPDNIPAGTYTLTYQVCRVSNGKCVSTTLTVIVPYLKANDDNFTFDGREIVGNVLTNDKVNNTTPVLSSNIQLSVLTRPSGTFVPTLDAQGNVHIGPRVQNGTYTFTYQLSSLNPVASDRATVLVTVPLLTVNPDTFTKTVVSTTHNILLNDRIDGTTVTPTMSDVEITVLTTPSVANPPVLDATTGNVTIPEDTPAGTYIITYRMCTKAPRRVVVCATSTVTVIVPDASQIAKAQDDNATTIMDAPVRIDVLANDTPKNVTPAIVSHPTNGNVTVNADGTITYQPNTGFIGNDNFAYQITDVFGNTSTANVRIEVVRGVHPHNGLSPDDGDGINDFFIIKGIEAFPNNVVKIFNRWGIQVFEVTGYNNRDKVFNGTSTARATMDASGKLPQGTYFYIIELNDPNGKEKDKSGSLYLKRQ